MTARCGNRALLRVSYTRNRFLHEKWPNVKYRLGSFSSFGIGLSICVRQPRAVRKSGRGGSTNMIGALARLEERLVRDTIGNRGRLAVVRAPSRAKSPGRADDSTVADRRWIGSKMRDAARWIAA